jgi:uncharacterized membrane protein
LVLDSLRGYPLHPMLVTVPIGAWFASLLFDIASYLVSRPGSLAEGSQWLIAIGVAGALASAVAGLVDMASVPAAAFPTARNHMCINILLIFAYAGNFAWRYRTHSYGAPVGAGMLGLSAASFVGLMVSGYLGGRLTYRYHVRVGTSARPASRVAAGTPVTTERPASGYRRR